MLQYVAVSCGALQCVASRCVSLGRCKWGGRCTGKLYGIEITHEHTAPCLCPSTIPRRRNLKVLPRMILLYPASGSNVVHDRKRERESAGERERECVCVSRISMFLYGMLVRTFVLRAHAYTCMHFYACTSKVRLDRSSSYA